MSILSCVMRWIKYRLMIGYNNNITIQLSDTRKSEMVANNGAK